MATRCRCCQAVQFDCTTGRAAPRGRALFVLREVLGLKRKSKKQKPHTGARCWDRQTTDVMAESSIDRWRRTFLYFDVFKRVFVFRFPIDSSREVEVVADRRTRAGGRAGAGTAPGPARSDPARAGPRPGRDPVWGPPAPAARQATATGRPRATRRPAGRPTTATRHAPGPVRNTGTRGHDQWAVRREHGPGGGAAPRNDTPAERAVSAN